MSQKNNTSQSEYKMSEESRRLIVPQELEQKQGQTLPTELNIMTPELSNQIEGLESEVKTLQSELQEERSEKKRMQDAHQSEVSALQMQLKGLKEELSSVSELLSKEEKKESNSNSSQIIDLERENKSLKEENKDMVFLIVQLEALCERQRVEKESLTQESEKLRESQRIMNDNLTVMTEDLASLQERKDAEVKQLRAALQVLQDDARILNEQNQNLMADLLQLQTIDKEKNKEIELLRPTVCDYEHLLAQTQQDHTIDGELLTVAELEQLKEKMMIEKQTAMEKSERFVKIINQEMIQLESQLEKAEAETEDLYTQFRSLEKEKCILNKNIQSLEDEVIQLQSLREKDQGQLQSMRTEVLKLGCQVKEAQDVRRDRDEIQNNLTHFESLLKTTQIEYRNLTEKFQATKGNEEFLYGQNEKLSAEVVRLETLLGKKSEETQNLKKTIQDLQCQLEEDIIVIHKNEELLQKKDRIITYQQQEIEEGDNIRMALQESFQDLKHQLERREEEEILAGVENIGAEIRRAASFPEDQRDDIFMHVPEEQPPAPQAQTKGFFRRCVGGVLKAGLTVGIATAAVGLTLGHLVSSIDTDSCLSACALQMIEPYCEKYYITPPPF